MARRSIHQNLKLHSQRTGNKSIKITLIEDQPEHCFTWSKYGNEYGKTVGKQLQKYCCTQCRSIYDKKKKNAEDTEPIPCLIFNVQDDRFESEIENHGHYCNPQPLNLIRGKEVRRNELAKIKHTRDKPAAISNLVNNVPIAAVYAHFDCEIGAVNALRLIANHRAKLLENLQLNAAVSRSDEIWKRLYHLGKAAGNN
jgi:hypothetical protein